jgi:hypothetical protein
VVWFEWLGLKSSTCWEVVKRYIDNLVKSGKIGDMTGGLLDGRNFMMTILIRYHLAERYTHKRYSLWNFLGAGSFRRADPWKSGLR